MPAQLHVRRVHLTGNEAKFLIRAEDAQTVDLFRSSGSAGKATLLVGRKEGNRSPGQLISQTGWLRLLRLLLEYPANILHRADVRSVVSCVVLVASQEPDLTAQN